MPLNTNIDNAQQQTQSQPQYYTIETEIYKNPFSTYQDMVDGDFIIENSDSDFEPELEPDEEDAEFEDGNDGENAETVEYVDNDEVVVNKKPEEDTKSEVSDVSDGPNTITVISSVFNFCKKVSDSNKALKKEVAELKQQMEDNKRQLDFFDNVIQFFVLATIFHFASVQIKLQSI
jgi:hypothetical protein